MNEKLQEAITEMIVKVNDGVDASTAFLSAELPDYIQQLLMWHAILSFLLFITAILFVGIAVIIQFKVILMKDSEGKLKFREKYSHIRDGHSTIALMSFLLWLSTAMFFTFSINLTWLQIWIAPKVWLVEYAANLVK